VLELPPVTDVPVGGGGGGGGGGEPPARFARPRPQPRTLNTSCALPLSVLSAAAAVQRWAAAPALRSARASWRGGCRTCAQPDPDHVGAWQARLLRQTPQAIQRCVQCKRERTTGRPIPDLYPMTCHPLKSGGTGQAIIRCRAHIRALCITELAGDTTGPPLPGPLPMATLSSPHHPASTRLLLLHAIFICQPCYTRLLQCSLVYWYDMGRVRTLHQHTLGGSGSSHAEQQHAEDGHGSRRHDLSRRWSPVRSDFGIKSVQRLKGDHLNVPAAHLSALDQRAGTYCAPRSTSPRTQG